MQSDSFEIGSHPLHLFEPSLYFTCYHGGVVVLVKTDLLVEDRELHLDYDIESLTGSMACI